MASIICADDERFMHGLYEGMLSAKGHDVRCFESGEEAVQAFAAETADLVILDVTMPGMSGLEACEEIRKMPDGRDVPIIIISARESEDDIIQGYAKGANDYLVKPVKGGEFLAKVALALNTPRPRSGEESMAVGSTFGGRYEIIRELGHGGFSVVLLAKDTGREPPEEVALKVVDAGPLKTRDKRYLSLFLREAYEHSKLDHPNIAEFYDFGRSGAYYYLAMEYVDGTTLEKMLLRGGALAQESVAFIGCEMAKALTYMNLFGILHRDIKPGNIMITGDGSVKLLDFGLARNEMEDTLALDEEFRGTPQYASPEFIVNVPDLDIRSDIYSLGVSLYYAATGAKPFPGDSTLEVLNSHFEHEPPPVNEVNPEMSMALSDIVRAMMQRQREDRPSLADILDAFEGVLDL